MVQASNELTASHPEIYRPSAKCVLVTWSGWDSEKRNTGERKNFWDLLR